MVEHFRTDQVSDSELSSTACGDVAGVLFAAPLIPRAEDADPAAEQPTKYELLINQAARWLGLPIPQSLLARADETIQ